MARKAKDVFGFDELEKAFKQCEKKYPDAADALLMAQGRQTNKRVKQLTPVRTRKLRNSWRLKKVKLYKGGKVRVVRIQSTAPHAHLVEYGHENYRGGKTRERGRKMSRKQLSKKGVTHHGRTEGTHMLEYGITEAGNRFPLKAQKMLDELVKDLKV